MRGPSSRHRDGVLEMRRRRRSAVTTVQRSGSVRTFALPEVEHRLDGEHEALPASAPRPARPVVRHLRLLVRLPPDAVPDQVAHDAVAGASATSWIAAPMSPSRFPAVPAAMPASSAAGSPPAAATSGSDLADRTVIAASAKKPVQLHAAVDADHVPLDQRRRSDGIPCTTSWLTLVQSVAGKP
jgi:hypothetical protein